MARTSPSDKMFARMDQSEYVVVPRNMVEELIYVRSIGDPNREALLIERAIAQAAVDDIL